MPHGKLGQASVSRLILGGNLIGGWAHARDLLYVGRLFKEYNTKQKIFETLKLCEIAGAIPPRNGFVYAFENGADFICVGMFDYQVTEDAQIVSDLFSKKIDRQRPWMA